MAETSSFQRVSSGGGSQSEKPFHYTYLKEFRVEQCKLFLQHKCTQHRPYTCFYWHFMNQRRRRPVRRREGTFNYSPDTYCSMYDENTGICPNGDDCPYLHRNAGDTERRYHLRYYKTSTCVYETDSRGFCVKNGPHCAFAHGPHDLRSPVYDIRESTGEGEEDRLLSPLVGSLEREKGVLVDDPRWHDSSFVLTYYKTDPCKRPPRLCRQGYACPFYHNNKDRRRSPKTFKYRSTPCPDVKVNDEWSDPINCDQKDHCSYCHTRTEQQFHPEIYKSTRCNDVQSTGYCPRGPYCAFAHDDKELSAPRELTEEPMTPENTSSVVSLDEPTTERSSSSLHRPSSAATPSSDAPSFQRAPGAEVRSKSFGEEDSQTYLKKQLQAIESDNSLDESEKQRRKQSLLRLSFVGNTASGTSPDGGGGTNIQQFQPSSLPSSVSDVLDVAIGQSVEDLSLEEIDQFVDNSAISIPRGGGGGGEGENEIPSGLGQSPVAQGFLQSLQSPFALSTFGSSLGPLSPFPAPHHIQPLQTNLGLATPTSPLASAMSPSTRGNMTIAQIVQSSAPGKAPGSPSRLSTPAAAATNATTTSSNEKQELFILREELKSVKTVNAALQESFKQLKQTCNAWKMEVEGTSSHIVVLEREKDNLLRQNERLEEQVKDLERKMFSVQTLSSLGSEGEGPTLNQLSLTRLIKLRNQLKEDFNRINAIISSKMTVLCVSCKDKPRAVLFQPCQHCLLCVQCTERLYDQQQLGGGSVLCPHCNARIAQKTTVLLLPSELS